MKITKLTLIIVGAITLIMGIAGLPGVSDMGTEPEWTNTKDRYRNSRYNNSTNGQKLL